MNAHVLTEAQIFEIVEASERNDKAKVYDILEQAGASNCAACENSKQLNQWVEYWRWKMSLNESVLN